MERGTESYYLSQKITAIQRQLKQETAGAMLTYILMGLEALKIIIIMIILFLIFVYSFTIVQAIQGRRDTHGRVLLNTDDVYSVYRSNTDCTV